MQWAPEEVSSLPGAPELVHGTCVALGRRAALLRGPPGSGKSDLALRFLYVSRRGPAALEAPVLVADDQVRLVNDGSRLLASPPETIRGRIEVRGVGIVAVKSIPEAELVLVVDLVEPAATERLPAWDARVALGGIDLPLLRLAPFENSAPIKLALALAHASRI
jgi:serine kinase of HPr protein (carbohydrate metabolism regulator)